MSLNVAIVGPVRTKQGTGPFIAKTFKQLGCNIQAIVSSSLESANKAAAYFEKEYSIDCKAYQSLDELLKSHTIDIVAISSPANTHLDYIQTSIQHGSHVFCEKPLWWPHNNVNSLSEIENITTDATSLITACKEKQTVLQLNTQWPYTLPSFYHLYPQLRLEHNIETFSMWLSPQSEHENMIVDAVSHTLSMLYTLTGAGKIENIESNFHQLANESDLQINFNYLHATGDTFVSVSLSSSNSFPKPAAYAVNGLRVDRHVELPDYLISLRTEENQIPMVDPLECSIKNFISTIYSKTCSDEVAVVDGITHLAQIYQAVTKTNN